MNRTIKEGATALLSDMNVSQNFWPFAVQTCVYNRNRVPSFAIKFKTPFEMLYGRKPEYERMQIFGSKAFVRKTGHLSKFDPTGEAAMLIGYPHNKSGYTLYLPDQRKIIESRDVKFTNQPFYKSSTTSDQYTDLFSPPITDTFAETNHYVDPDSLITPTDSQTVSPQTTNENTDTHVSIEPTASTENISSESTNSTVQPAQRSTDESTHTAQTPTIGPPEARQNSGTFIHLTKRQFDDYITQNPNRQIVPTTGRPKKVCENGRPTSAYRYQLNYINPKTVVDRLLETPEADAWKNAMSEEIKSQHANNTWTLVP